ncbi:MAG TPA: hypothetical protein VGS08_01150 [Candidatus Saccharimonadales bacterium]|nr:hypothetical protein [Candidatus Saccharimonadales bacterium]
MFPLDRGGRKQIPLAMAILERPQWQHSIERITTIRHRLNWWLMGGLLIAIATHANWIFGHGILSYEDWSYIYPRALKELFALPYAWDPKGLGQLNLTAAVYPLNLVAGLLAHLGATYATTERLTFMWPTLIAGFASPFYLIRYLTKSNKAGFIAGLIYQYNVISLLEQTQHLTIFGAEAFAPLALLFLIRAFRERTAVDVAKAGLFGFVVCWYDFRIFYILSLIVIPFAGLELLRGVYSLRSWILRTLTVLGGLLVTMLLNTFWFIAVGLGGQVSSNAIFNRGLFGYQYLSLMNALALYHSFWTTIGPQWFTIHSPSLYFWILPCLAVYAIISARDKFTVLLFATLGLIGIFLTKEIAVPFGEVYLWLFGHLPGFNAFRDASKFYFLISLSYAGLIGSLFANHLSKRTTRRYFNSTYLLLALIVLVLGANLLPLARGYMGSLFVTRHIPNDYQIISQKLLQNNSYFRTLWVPQPSRWSEYNLLHPQLSLAGLDQNYIDPNPTPAIFPTGSSQLMASGDFAHLLSAASVRYVIVPLRDTANDDDFFPSYGNDRQYFINALNNLGFLRRINIGTKQLVVYENTTFRPYVTTDSSITDIPLSSEIPSLWPLVSRSSPDFAVSGTANPQDGSIRPLFDAQMGNPDQTSGLQERTQLPANSYLYTVPTARDITYQIVKGGLQFSDMAAGGALTMNGTAIDTIHPSLPKLNPIPLSPKSTYFVGAGSSLQPIDLSSTKQQYIGNVSGPIMLYSSDTANLLPDASFESGLWQKTVGDCNNYDNESIIAMSLSNQATDGNHALELDSLKHTACTEEQAIGLSANQTYLFRFDYENQGGQKVGYKIYFNDPAHTTISQDLPTNGLHWRTLLRSITIPAEATTLRLQVFGYPDSNGRYNSQSFYDNFRLNRLSPLLNLPGVSGTSGMTKLSAEPVEFSFHNQNYSSQNLIPNGSFSHGLWQKTVGDCNNYDANPQISMRLYNGAMELAATRHTACSGVQALPVNANATYLLSFDYQSPDNANASYNVSYDDPRQTALTNQLAVSNSNWRHYAATLTVPSGASTISLTAYAAPHSYGNLQSIIRYNHFRLVHVPPVFSRYYLVTKPAAQTALPQHVSYHIDSPTKNIIRVTGASSPFYLNLSEAYDPHWQLVLDNTAVQGADGWLPLGHPTIVRDHYELNDFMNSWRIDPTQLCDAATAGCQQEANGSYDLTLIADFTPQHWNDAGLLISSTFLLVIVIYLLRSKKPSTRTYRARL